MRKMFTRAVAGAAWMGLTSPAAHFWRRSVGARKNVRFRYRLMLGAVQNDRQTVQLYLTPEPKLQGKESLAFEYRYVRLP